MLHRMLHRMGLTPVGAWCVVQGARRWQPLPDMPGPGRCMAAACALDHATVLLCGGNTFDPEAGPLD